MLLGILFAVTVLFLFPEPAFPAPSATSLAETTTVGSSWTQVFNFDSKAFRYENLQIVNPGAQALTCAKSDTGTPTTSLFIPETFVSATWDRYRPDGILYCKFDSGSYDVTVIVWGLNP